MRTIQMEQRRRRASDHTPPPPEERTRRPQCPEPAVHTPQRSAEQRRGNRNNVCSVRCDWVRREKRDAHRKKWAERKERELEGKKERVEMVRRTQKDTENKKTNQTRGKERVGFVIRGECAASHKKHTHIPARTHRHTITHVHTHTRKHASTTHTYTHTEHDLRGTEWGVTFSCSPNASKISRRECRPA